MKTRSTICEIMKRRASMPDRPPPRAIHRKPKSAVTQNLIIRVTELTIADLGIARVTTRRIAEVAGVSEATIFKYFSTKDELIIAALRRGSLPSTDLLREIDRPVGSVEDGLRRIAEVALRYYDQMMGPLVAAMADIGILPRHREWLLEKMPTEELSAVIVSFVEAEQSIGRIRPGIDPKAIAGLFLGAALRQIMDRMFRGDLSTPTADERFAREFARGMFPMIADDTSGDLQTPRRGRISAAKR